MIGTAEFCALDCSDVRNAIDRFGITLPNWRAPVYGCDERNVHGFYCMRPKGHGGRHAATISGGTVVAVWRPR